MGAGLTPLSHVSSPSVIRMTFRERQERSPCARVPMGDGTVAPLNGSLKEPEKYWFMLKSTPPSGVLPNAPISRLELQQVLSAMPRMLATLLAAGGFCQ